MARVRRAGHAAPLTCCRMPGSGLLARAAPIRVRPGGQVMTTTRSVRPGPGVRGWRRWRLAAACAAVFTVSLPLSLAAQVSAVPSASADLAPPNPVPQVIPKPVALTAGQGTFTLAPTARIVVPPGSEAALPVAADLAADLQPATGYVLPVVTGTPQSGDIQLV